MKNQEIIRSVERVHALDIRCFKRAVCTVRRLGASANREDKDDLCYWFAKVRESRALVREALRFSRTFSAVKGGAA